MHVWDVHKLRNAVPCPRCAVQEETLRSHKAIKQQLADAMAGSQSAGLELEKARTEAEERRLQVQVLMQTVETLQVRTYALGTSSQDTTCHSSQRH